MAQDGPKRDEEKKMLLGSAVDIAIFPFFEDLPRKIATFDLEDEPVLAWEREAR